MSGTAEKHENISVPLESDDSREWANELEKAQFVNGGWKCTQCGQIWRVPELLSQVGRCVECMDFEARQRAANLAFLRSQGALK